MEIKIDRDIILKCLNHIQGVVEKKNTLPILANVLIEAFDNKIQISATDLDIIITEKIDAEVIKEGSTTTTAQVLYDLIRKLPSGSSIHLNLQNDKRLKLISGKSDFNLTCLPASEFPILEDSIESDYLEVKSKHLLKLLNKCKFSVSNDETRHYLSGIFFHQTETEDKNFLTAAATDSHRMSISKIRLDKKVDFEPIILPKKTIFQLCSLLENYDGDVKISNIKSKIKFEFNNSILISKLIDGKFPNYIQVIPKNNQKKLEIDLKLFLDSVDRVASVSLDKKDGVKFNLSKDVLNLSVNNTNSGDGKESLNVKFEYDLEISFNSRYLIDVAAQLDGNKIEIFFNDTSSPALIKDPGDFDSIFVVMPMKG